VNDQAQLRATTDQLVIGESVVAQMAEIGQVHILGDPRPLACLRECPIDAGDKLASRERAIFAERDRKLDAARERRRAAREASRATV
jgi:hypothetical protein